MRSPPITVRLLGIDVDAEGHAAVRAIGGHRGDRAPHRANRRRSVAGLDDELGALAAAQPKQRRGTEDLPLGDLSQSRAQRLRVLPVGRRG